MLTDESEILVPSKDTIIIFRRDLDGKIYYKASDNSITQITEEDGIYKIQSVEGLLHFNNIRNFTGEQLSTERNTNQEFFFSVKESKVIARGPQGVPGPSDIYFGTTQPSNPKVNQTLWVDI